MIPLTKPATRLVVVAVFILVPLHAVFAQGCPEGCVLRPEALGNRIVNTPTPSLSDAYGAYSAKDYQTAFRIVSLFADRGNAEAQDFLGFMYWQGQGVAENDQTAVNWYRKAAEQDLAAAQYHLGLMYERGDGVPKNSMEAVIWYLKAVAQGHNDAKTHLVDMSNRQEPLRQGLTVTADGKARPATGYEWDGDPQKNNLAVKLKQGLKLASTNPNLFQPAPGYIWDGDPQKNNLAVQPAPGYVRIAPNDPKNFSIMLKPGIMLTDDGKFQPAPGYIWDGDPQKNNFAVKPEPDVPHYRANLGTTVYAVPEVKQTPAPVQITQTSSPADSKFDPPEPLLANATADNNAADSSRANETLDAETKKLNAYFNTPAQPSNRETPRVDNSQVVPSVGGIFAALFFGASGAIFALIGSGSIRFGKEFSENSTKFFEGDPVFILKRGIETRTVDPWKEFADEVNNSPEAKTALSMFGLPLFKWTLNQVSFRRDHLVSLAKARVTGPGFTLLNFPSVKNIEESFQILYALTSRHPIVFDEH